MSAAYSTRTAQFNDRHAAPKRTRVIPAISDGIRPGLLASLAGPQARRWARQIGVAGLSLVCAFLLGCGESFDGPPEIVPARLNTTLDSFTVLKDGDAIDLQPPIQGGWVLFVGAAVRNFSSSGGSLLGELRRAKASDGSPLSQPGSILYSDERTAPTVALPAGFVPPSTSGTVAWRLTEPNPNDTANISTCPNPLDINIADVVFFLQVTYRDKLGRSATSYRKVVPRCTSPDPLAMADCRCQCAANYLPEKCVIR